MSRQNRRMRSAALDQSIADTTAPARAQPGPANRVAAIAPLHLGADPDHGLSLRHGRNINTFDLFDVAAGMRCPVNLAPTES